MFDWGAGEYERTAAELEPGSRHVVDLAEPTPGERVLDVACGTGNAALLAAAAGAEVTGLDAAARLIEVARARSVAAGLDATFVAGDAMELPFADDAFDAVLSVFGIIFVPDAERALGEVFRVLRPGGRALIAAWVPRGAIHEMVTALARGVSSAGGPERPRFAWYDPAAYEPIAARHGATVDAEEASVAVTGASPEAYFADGEEHHPMSVAMRGLLERSGRYPELREEAVAALRAGNEDPDGFRVTSPYRVIRLTLPE
jgi:ubiquinone/menaquinone biosynthesis C-methylase UbiE